jgi:hypothetical protein
MRGLGWRQTQIPPTTSGHKASDSPKGQTDRRSGGADIEQFNERQLRHTRISDHRQRSPDESAVKNQPAAAPDLEGINERNIRRVKQTRRQPSAQKTRYQDEKNEIIDVARFNSGIFRAPANQLPAREIPQQHQGGIPLDVQRFVEERVHCKTVDLARRPTAKLCAIARALVYLLAWQLQFALSALGANDGFRMPITISAAAAILSMVSIVPSELGQALALQLQLASSAFGVNEGFKSPMAISVAAAILSNVIIGFTLNGAGILPPASRGEATKPSARPGPSNHKPARANSGRALKVDLGSSPMERSALERSGQVSEVADARDIFRKGASDGFQVKSARL